jgi:hypothetical protein
MGMVRFNRLTITILESLQKHHILAELIEVHNEREYLNSSTVIILTSFD